jgi:hypothetical protein
MDIKKGREEKNNKNNAIVSCSGAAKTTYVLVSVGNFALLFTI